MPHLKELVELHADQPFALVGVNCHDDRETYKKGVSEHGVTWTCAYQNDGKKAPIADLFRVQAFPTIFVLDAEGRIQAKDLRGASLKRFVGELLAPGDAGDARGADGESPRR